MKLGKTLLLLALFALAAPIALFAQGESEAIPELAPWMEEAMKLSQPGPEHALLVGLEGKWDMTGWIMPMPGAVPIDFAGTAVNEMILGGRFLLMTSESGEGEMYTETMTILGFDRRSNEYTFVGYDTWGTFYVTAMGGYNDTTKVITMYGEEADVIAGFTQKYDQAIQIVDKDKFILTTVFYNKEMTGGAEQFKMLEITYTRAK